VPLLARRKQGEIQEEDGARARKRKRKEKTVHRREGYLTSVQIKLVIFALVFYSSADCPSLVAAGNGLGTGLWVPRSKTCEHVNNGASTPEATPRLCAAGAGGEKKG
jgi:hypothetical protein